MTLPLPPQPPGELPGDATGDAPGTAAPAGTPGEASGEVRGGTTAQAPGATPGTASGAAPVTAAPGVPGTAAPAGMLAAAPAGTPAAIPARTPAAVPARTPAAASAGISGDALGPGRSAGDGIRARLLDRALATAVSRVGAPGRIRFTERQLYYEMCRVLRPLGAVPRRVPVTPAAPVRYERFEEALRRYGEVPGLLGPVPVPVPDAPEAEAEPEGRTVQAEPQPQQPTEPDLYDYGLPRLLVCQSRSVARMLLANDVHLEAACPVLTADDLPLDPRLVAGLGRVDGATVHVLHDASTAGLALVTRVRESITNAQAAPAIPGAHAVRVASMGLVPRHAAALHLTSRRGLAPDPDGPEPPVAQAALRPRERDWLAEGRFAEVEAVPPARLLRTVLRQVRGPRMPDHSIWTGLRELRTAGFMSWPTNRPGETTRYEDTRR
ncbi:hypothetical protein ACFXCZ_01340 [Streptomyces sp. NPDC059396]|uniref:hypothetical protein n=1 Tax=Streptomyces sp. NPDC059396 TaxID=3346819 RepID=UPI00367CA9C8